MTTKELFIEKQPELATALKALTQNTWFQLALVPVDSEVFQHSTGPEFIAGARFYKQTLLTLANAEEPETESQPQPGLVDPSFPNSVTAKQQSPQT